MLACGQQTSQKDVPLKITAGVLVVSTTSLPNTKVPDTGTCGKALPDGLALNAVTGEISGTPTETGMEISVIVADSSTTSAIDGPYDVTITADGGMPAYKWSVSAGALPPGIVLSDGGVFSGTPTSQGIFDFDVIVTDSVGATDSESLSINVFGIVTMSLPESLVGLPYNGELEAKGGVLPYTWSLKVCQ